MGTLSTIRNKTENGQNTRSNKLKAEEKIT